MKKPSKWEMKVTAARYLMCGMTQTQVGGLIGVTGSTIGSWTRQPDWSEAMREAHSVEFSEMAAKALGLVKESIDAGDVKVAQWYLAKVHPVFSDKTARSPLAVGEEKEQDAIDLSKLSERELRRLASDDDPVLDAEFEDDE